MKKIYLAILFMIPLLMTSCLKSDLDDIEVYQDAEITGIRGLYYYYNAGETATGYEIFDWGNISRSGVNIDSDAATVTVEKATPAAAKIAEFDQKKVVMYLNISTAATIEPVDGSAILGVEADWTAGKANKYKVTAADGTAKIWTVTIQNYVLE